MKKKRRTVPDDVRVYTVREVMIILGISSSTAYKLVKSGVFHTLQVGGHYRIPRRGFEKWLESIRCGERGAAR